MAGNNGLSLSRVTGTGDVLFGVENENTGINSSAVNTLNFVTGGTSRASVNNSGVSFGGTLAVNGTLTLSAASITAAGTVLANATQITTTVADVAGADNAKGVVLPLGNAGQLTAVYTSVATDGLKVYPAVNCAINGGLANTAIVLEGKTLAVFVQTNTNHFASVFTANT